MDNINDNDSDSDNDEVDTSRYANDIEGVRAQENDDPWEISNNIKVLNTELSQYAQVARFSQKMELESRRRASTALEEF